MLEYTTFCYLQNHKTGCTFVETVLREFCKEELINYRKHAALDNKLDKFCFANVREPLSAYKSLFTYGLDKTGAVYERLVRFNHAQFYERGAEGFEEWLDFVIRPKNASFLADEYTPEIARKVGFMTWRFLRLACPGFEHSVKSLHSSNELSEYIKANWTLGAVLHQERLKIELQNLIRDKLSHAFDNLDEVISWLEKAPKINASSVELKDQKISGDLLKRILRKEAFIYQTFYKSTQQHYAALLGGGVQ